MFQLLSAGNSRTLRSVRTPEAPPLRAYAVTTLDKRPEDGFSFDASIYTSNGSAAQPGDYTQVDESVTFNRNDFSRATVNGQRRYRA